MFDRAPGADPGGGGSAAPRGVEDEADDGEESYEEGEGEDAGESEFLFARDAGFEGEGDGDYGNCLEGFCVSWGALRGAWEEKGGKKAVRRLSTRSPTVRCTICVTCAHGLLVARCSRNRLLHCAACTVGKDD